MSDAIQKATRGLGPSPDGQSVALRGDHQGPYPSEGGTTNPDTYLLETRGMLSTEAYTLTVSGMHTYQRPVEVTPTEGSRIVATHWRELSEELIRAFTFALRRGRLGVTVRPERTDFVDAKRGLLASFNHDDAERLSEVLDSPQVKNRLVSLEDATAFVLEALREFAT